MLEVIDRGSATKEHPVPLLFVHGGWHGAWCWDDHFLDFFSMGHNMMLEPGWADVADRIHTWLETRGLTS